MDRDCDEVAHEYADCRPEHRRARCVRAKGHDGSHSDGLGMSWVTRSAARMKADAADANRKEEAP